MIKDQAYYNLPTEQKLLALCGVPLSYLKKPVQFHQLNFAVTSFLDQKNPEAKEIKIQPDYQRMFLLDFFKNMKHLGDPTLYAIGSYPTNQSAYQLATMITSTYFEYIKGEKRVYPNCKWIDLGCPEYAFLKTNADTSLLILHGLSESSDTRRLELTKDFIRKGSNTTTIVLANTSNILQFIIGKLENQPDAVFQLLQTTNILV